MHHYLDDQDQAACYDEQPEEEFVAIYDQDQQIDLAKRNAETWDSITNGGTYSPGSQYQAGPQPYWPTQEDIKAW